jgi:hypothetical protein
LVKITLFLEETTANKEIFSEIKPSLSPMINHNLKFQQFTELTVELKSKILYDFRNRIHELRNSHVELN